MAKTGFTEPTLFSYNGNMKKDWFVGFRMTDSKSGVRKPFQIRASINYKKIKSDRLLYGHALEKDIKQALIDGWDPFNTRFDEFSIDDEPIQETPDINKKTFDKALDFCLEKGSWAKKTTFSFNGTVKYYKDAAKKLNLLETDVKLITKQHIVQLSHQAKETLGWSNQSYNKYIGYLGSIMKVLVDWHIIENNPTHGFTHKPTVETHKYVSYTEKEKKLISEKLISFNYRYYICWQVTYQTGIRPKEVLALTISDISFDNQEITILPDMETENSKTKSIRHVPISRYLLKLLKEMKLEALPANYYVFGSPFKEGKGNRGRAADGSYGASNPAFLMPSMVAVKRDTFTKLWKKLIIDGLGINKYAYAAKHTGGDEKILAGVDLGALQSMYGHASKQMTEKYIKALQQVNKKNIIDLSPDFLA